MGQRDAIQPDHRSDGRARGNDSASDLEAGRDMQGGEERGKNHRGSGTLHEDAECAGDDQKRHHSCCVVVYVRRHESIFLELAVEIVIVRSLMLTSLILVPLIVADHRAFQVSIAYMYQVYTCRS